MIGIEAFVFVVAIAVLAIEQECEKFLPNAYGRCLFTATTALFFSLFALLISLAH